MAIRCTGELIHKMVQKPLIYQKLNAKSFQFQPMGYSGSSPGNYGPPGSGGSAGGGNNGGGPPGPSTPIMPSPQDSSNSGGENIYTMMKPEFPMGGPPGGGPGNGNVGPVGTGPDGVPIGGSGGGPANGGPPGGGPGGAPGGPGKLSR